MEAVQTQTEAVGKYTFTMEVFAQRSKRGSIATIKVEQATPKARYSDSKLIEYWGYRTIEEADRAFTKKVSDCKQRVEQIAEFKQAQREARANVSAAEYFKVGDILNTSWGYEQTNVEFYQVIEVKPKTITVQCICSRMVEGSAGYMSHSVMPVPDSMDAAGEEAFALRVKPSGGLSAINGYIYVTKWGGYPQYVSYYA